MMATAQQVAEAIEEFEDAVLYHASTGNGRARVDSARSALAASLDANRKNYRDEWCRKRAELRRMTGERDRLAEALEQVGDAPPAACSEAPAGWKMVPIVPTETMLRAMTDGFIAINGSNFDEFMRAYPAMLAASPPEPPVRRPPLRDAEITLMLGALNRLWAGLESAHAASPPNPQS